MLTGRVKFEVGRALDLLLPRQSLLTGELSPSAIEGDMWGLVRFLDDPCCTVCGFPFDFDLGDEALCGRCSVKLPAFSTARAAFQYDDHSRKMVLSFKHGGRTQGLRVFATHMSRAGRSFLQGADYLVPVPLHYSRLVKRRFNQSTLLARALTRHSQAKFDPDILMRHRATPTQAGKTAAGRRRNVSGAFRVRPNAKARLRGKHIIVIDDVMTTGATLESCAKTLKRAGAARVDALTLARVVRPAPLPT